MDLIFLGLFAQLLGANIEGYARESPALRPAHPVSGIWYLMGKLTAYSIPVAFVAALFVFPWWVAILIFVAAFIAQLFVVGWLRKVGAAPGISMVLMVVGAIVTLVGLMNPSAGAF